MRFIESQVEDHSIRIVGLANQMANAQDLGDWLIASNENCLTLHPTNRPLPLEAMRPSNRENVLHLFRNGVLRVLLSYDGKEHRFVDYLLADVHRMTWFANWPLEDHNATCTVFCRFYKKLHVRKYSSCDHVNAEVVTKTIEIEQGAVDYLTWSFLTNVHLSDVVERTVNGLAESRCIAVANELDRSTSGWSLPTAMADKPTVYPALLAHDVVDAHADLLRRSDDSMDEHEHKPTPAAVIDAVDEAVCTSPAARFCARCEPRPRRTLSAIDLVLAAQVNAYLLARSPKAQWGSIVDNFGRNPLHLAIAHRHASAVEHMVSQRPLLLLATDAFQQSGMELLLHELPHVVLRLVQQLPVLLQISDDKNNTFAHVLCRALPPTDFAALVNVLPRVMFLTSNDDDETPVMRACKMAYHMREGVPAAPHANGHLLLHVGRSVVLETPDLFTVSGTTEFQKSAYPIG
ncbi:hypothetical protein SPRG_00244 [Saprolegnia parasitica CBS 223.65]|uniref:MER3 helicase-like winged helix domain-containing protein n=1 Tax=Saprolegnia parasitica (strain CBS 223.65) TaxID=695850 RepID=A0A067CXF5_SAPPC|nr:hypothetical protein SPRG_00244 [Saprolegnia parasitica CBS 223.65]KDO35394.1 hypothetical protein SPRG_00244 [Saprolegnia parasitica CBS 223.65]|eukprot:XP_012193737.1 hypothetical protein SPRG_00244 [Saprolegnia parasitica CBS 223.65]